MSLTRFKTLSIFDGIATGLFMFQIPSQPANSQTVNAVPTATTLTAVNTKTFTGTAGHIVLPAITPAANGGGITLTGLNFAQGAISNVADSEAITVKHIVMTFAAGAALETGVLTQTAIDITLANQAANAANNQATGIKITGGTLAGGASAYQRGIDITMAAATDAAIRVAVGLTRLPSDAIEGLSASGRVTIYGGLNGSTAAGSGAVLSLDAESFAGTPGAMRVYTPNAAGTDNILRLVVNGMAAQGSGGITSYEPVTLFAQAATDGQTNDAPLFTLRNYYDADAGAGVTSTAWDLSLLHDMTAGGAAPASSGIVKINNVTVLTLTNTNGTPSATFPGAVTISGATPLLQLTHTNTANYGQILFYENTTPAGAVQAIGSTFTTAGRRKNLEIVNSLDGGRIAFRVSPGAVGQEVGSIYTNSLHIGSDTGYFTAYGLPFSGGAFSVGIGFGATVTVTDDTYKEALHVALIGQKTSAAWAAGALEGLEGEVRVGAANTQNWTLPLGLIGAFGHPLIETGSSGTITGVVGLLSSGGWIGAGASVTKWYGAYLANPVPSGTLLAENYGLYIEAMTAGNSLNYAIYSAGGLNHFVGNVNTVDVYSVDGTQVVGPRQVDARINDTPNSGDATTDGIIAALQACVQTHGLMTAA